MSGFSILMETLEEVREDVFLADRQFAQQVSLYVRARRFKGVILIPESEQNMPGVSTRSYSIVMSTLIKEGVRVVDWRDTGEYGNAEGWYCFSVRR